MINFNNDEIRQRLYSCIVYALVKILQCKVCVSVESVFAILPYRFNFLFIPCGAVSWLPISFLLHVKCTLSYRIIVAILYCYNAF